MMVGASQLFPAIPWGLKNAAGNSSAGGDVPKGQFLKRRVQLRLTISRLLRSHPKERERLIKELKEMYGDTPLWLSIERQWRGLSRTFKIKLSKGWFDNLDGLDEAATSKKYRDLVNRWLKENPKVVEQIAVYQRLFENEPLPRLVVELNFPKFVELTLEPLSRKNTELTKLLGSEEAQSEAGSVIVEFYRKPPQTGTVENLHSYMAKTHRNNLLARVLEINPPPLNQEVWIPDQNPNPELETEWQQKKRRKIERHQTLELITEKDSFGWNKSGDKLMTHLNASEPDRDPSSLVRQTIEAIEHPRWRDVGLNLISESPVPQAELAAKWEVVREIISRDTARVRDIIRKKLAR